VKCFDNPEPRFLIRNNGSAIFDSVQRIIHTEGRAGECVCGTAKEMVVLFFCDSEDVGNFFSYLFTFQDLRASVSCKACSNFDKNYLGIGKAILSYHGLQFLHT
jgi:hypothetical protein